MVNAAWEPQAEFSCLVNGPDLPPLTEEIQEITGITPELLEKSGVPIQQMAKDLSTLVGTYAPFEYVVAFNRAFDQPIIGAEAARWQLWHDPMIAGILSIPWVCAMEDVQENYKFKSWKLMHLALDHGVTVNPKILHRAVNDVDLMRQMLAASGTRATTMYAFQCLPSIIVRAMIPKPWEDGGKGRDSAKKLGYAWETPRGVYDMKFESAWVKRIKEIDLHDEIKKCPFTVRQIK